MTDKSEESIGSMVEFHVKSALTILDDVVYNRVVDPEMVSEYLYEPMVNSEDDHEQKVWKAIRKYIER
jgi:hypothetical protein